MRRLTGLVLVVAVAVAALFTQAAVTGGPPACLVSNERSGFVTSSLQSAVDAAAPGDTLIVKGKCIGTTTLTKSITIKGVSDGAFGVATLDGNGAGTTLTVPGAQTVVLEGLVVTGGSGDGGV